MNLREALATALIALVPLSLGAMDRQTLTTIYTGPNTEPASPFFAEIEVKNAELKRAVDGAETVLRRESRTLARPKGSFDASGFFPIQTTLLRVATPQVRRVEKLEQPIFVIGMDRLSLTWLKDNIQTIQQLKATGVVIKASDFRAFSILQSEAAKLGVEITALSGDALAQGYGIRTYPTLLIGVEHAR